MKLSKKLIGLMLVLSVGGAIVGCSPDKAPEQDLTIEETQENENTEQEGEDASGSDEDKVEANDNEEKQPEAEKPETEKPEQKPEANKPAAKPEQKPEVNKPAAKPEQKPGTSKPEVEKPVEKPAETTNLSASELYNKVVTSDLNIPSLVEMDSQFFADTYGIDTSLLKSYKVNMPMMMVHASEIAVFELNNASDAQKVMDGINKRVSGLKAQWESYLPEQLELVNNYKTATKGNYIIFVVSEHADTIINNFNANVK